MTTAVGWTATSAPNVVTELHDQERPQQWMWRLSSEMVSAEMPMTLSLVPVMPEAAPCGMSRALFLKY